jgi:hypothetical protein
MKSTPERNRSCTRGKETNPLPLLPDLAGSGRIGEGKETVTAIEPHPALNTFLGLQEPA